MITLSIWPTQAQFRPGQPVGFRITANDASPGRLDVHGRVIGGALWRATDQARESPEFDLVLEVGADGSAVGEASIELGAVDLPPRQAVGFAVRVEDAASGAFATTAFDVAEHWTSAPRYGFFSDFSSDETAEESRARADEMLRSHLNVIQFYDWMYSHHTLVPPAAEFVDPLGRHLSRDLGRRKVDLAHERGMAAIAYGALYGAELDFSEQHPDWLLYDGKHTALELADIFYLQDIRPVSGWRRWIIDQYRLAVTEMGFDGIHIDQYGYPKRSLSKATGEWEEVDLGAEFAGFVEQACTEVLDIAPDGGSIFNLVNAWPLGEMKSVTADAATYIEVWEPHSTYRDLYDLISRARALRPDKHVILAAYLRSFHPVDGRSNGAMNAFRLAWAAIASSGGFHLIIGEGTGLLTEAYYPNYGHLSGAEAVVLRSYADFVVRHTAALHSAGADIAWTSVGPTNDVVLLDHPDLPIDHRMGYSAGAVLGTVWVTGRDFGPVTVLNLVNLVGVKSDVWNSDQPDAPASFEGIEVRAVVTGGVAGVWWDTPDDEIGTPRTIDFEVVDDEKNRFLVFRLPSLDYWSLVWWERTA